MEGKETNTLPILALIFGIAAFITSFTVVLGVICGLVSIVLSIICFAKKKPVAMPIIGIICSVVGIIISTIALFVGMIIYMGNDGIVLKTRDYRDSLLTQDDYVSDIQNTILEIKENTKPVDENNLQGRKGSEFIINGISYKLND